MLAPDRCACLFSGNDINLPRGLSEWFPMTAPATTTDSRSHKQLIANLIAQISFGLIAMTICLPSMQEWGQIFQATQAEVQLTFSFYVVAYGAFQLLYGPLSDRYGRKPVLLIGLLLALVGSVCCAVSTNLWMLSMARAVQGAGSAAGMVIGRSMVQDLFRGAERTRVMAYIGMALGLCPPIASIIGGQIHVHLGWQGNFVVMAVLSALLMGATWRGLPVLVHATTHDMHWLAHMLSAYRRLVRERDFVLYVVILAMTTSTFYIFLAGAPIVLSAYGVGPEGVGWYIMCVPVTYIAGNFITSHLIHRVGEQRMMVWGQVTALSGLALLLLLGFSGVNSPWAFTVPLMLLGLGHGFLNPPALAGTVGVVPALAGSAAAVAGLMQQLTGAVGGAWVGWVSHENAVNLGLLMLGFTVCGLMGQLALHRRAVSRG